MTPYPKYIPPGRLPDLLARPDADRIAYTVPLNIWADYPVKVYASRAEMLHFCKDGSRHFALVRTLTTRSMLTNHNTERVAP